MRSTILFLTTVPLARDPRASRGAKAADSRQLEVASVSASGDVPHRTARRPADSRLGLELRGMYRLARLAVATIGLVRRGWNNTPAIVHAHDLDTLPAGWLLAAQHARGSSTTRTSCTRDSDADPPRLWSP